QRAALGDLQESTGARWTYSTGACCATDHKASSTTNPAGFYRSRRLRPAERGLRQIHSWTNLGGRQPDQERLGNARTRQEPQPQLFNARASKGSRGRRATP